MFQKNAWLDYSNEEFQKVMEFSEEYKDYLNKGKTERNCVNEALRLAEAKGFKSIESFKEIKTGDKIYVTNKGKNIACFVIGTKPLSEGLRVLGADRKSVV